MNILLRILVLSTLIANAWPKTPAEISNFQVIDYHAFTQLPRDAQREYLKIVMEMIVSMEDAMVSKGEGIYPKLTPQQKRTVELWKQLINKLTIEDAYAVDPENQLLGNCVYAGWFSTFVDTTNYDRVYGKPAAAGSPPKKHCQNPITSIDPKVRSAYQAAKRNCPGETMACNPEIFGTDTRTNKPDCVDINKLSSQNASLACLVAAQADPDSDKRLDNMIDRLASRTDCAEDFNKVVQSIFNTCVCQQNPQNVGRNVQLAPDYFNYMKGHRTCYSLLSQTQRLAQRMSANKEKLRACWVINKDNVDILANDLSMMADYTNRLDALMTPADNNDYNKVLERLKLPRLRDNLLGAGKGVDDIGPYDQCLEKLRNPNSTSSCALPGGASIQAVQGHCPIVIPPLTARDCKVQVAAGDVTDEGIAYTVNLSLDPQHSNMSAAKVKWTVSGKAVEGQEGLTLSGKLPPTTAGENEGQLKLNAVITIGTETFNCPYDQKITGQRNGCIVQVADASYDKATRKVKTSAQVLKAGGGELPKESYDKILWKVGEEAESEGSLTKEIELTASANETKIVVGAKLSKSGVAGITCAAGEKNVTTPEEAPAMACEITDQKYDPATKTVSAKATFKNKPEGQADPTSLKWKVADGEIDGGATFSKVIAEQKAEFSISAVATLASTSTGPVAAQSIPCPPVKVAVTAPVQPKPDEVKPLVCTISFLYDESKQELQATLAGEEPKANTAITWGGGFTVDAKNKMIAVKSVKPGATEQSTDASADYKNKDDKPVKCTATHKLPPSRQPAGTGTPLPQQQMPMGPIIPDMPDIFLQGIR